MEFDKFREIVSEVLEIGMEEVIEQALLVDDLGVDSMELMDILLRTEEVFDVMPDVDPSLTDIRTVGDAYRSFVVSAGKNA